MVPHPVYQLAGERRRENIARAYSRSIAIRRAQAKTLLAAAAIMNALFNLGTGGLFKKGVGSGLFDIRPSR